MGTKDSIPIIYNGKTYSSRKACCHAYEINYEKVEKMISRKGVSFQEALDYFINQEFTYNGTKYKDLRTCCVMIGVDYQKVMRCIKVMGKSANDALIYCLEGRRICSGKKRKDSVPSGEIQVTYNGVTYPSISACCKALGIYPQKLYNYKRAQNLKSIEEAIIYYENVVRNHHRHGKSVVVNGTAYQSVKECLDAHNIPRSTITDIMKKQHLKVEEAIVYYCQTGCRRRGDRNFLYSGITYPNVKACCKALNISPDKVYSIKRHQKMLSYEEAIDFALSLEKTDRSKNQYGKRVTYNGIIYPSVEACCKALNISARKVYDAKRHHRMATYEEAIKYVLIPDKDKENNRLLKISKSITYNGVIYPSHRACCIALGVPEHRIYNLTIQMDCSFEEALSMYILALKGSTV